MPDQATDPRDEAQPDIIGPWTILDESDGYDAGQTRIRATHEDGSRIFVRGPLPARPTADPTIQIDSGPRTASLCERVPVILAVLRAARLVPGEGELAQLKEECELWRERAEIFELRILRALAWLRERELDGGATTTVCALDVRDRLTSGPTPPDEDIPFGEEEIDLRGCQTHSP